MKKSVYVASLCLGVYASGASAADVSIKGNLNETLTGSDNYFLSNTPSGSTFKSHGTFNLDVLARTPGWRYLLVSNLSYYNYFGSGADSTSPKSGVPVTETFRVDHTTDLGKYFFSATWHREDVATTQLRESGVVTGTGETDQFTVRGGATYDLSRTDSITWSGQVRRVTFTNTSSQTPYNDYAAYGRLEQAA